MKKSMDKRVADHLKKTYGIAKDGEKEPGHEDPWDRVRAEWFYAGVAWGVKLAKRSALNRAGVTK